MRLRKDLRNKPIQDLSFFISVIVKRTSTRKEQLFSMFIRLSIAPQKHPCKTRHLERSIQEHAGQVTISLTEFDVSFKGTSYILELNNITSQKIVASFLYFALKH